MRILELISEKPPSTSGFARTIHEIQTRLINQHRYSVDVISIQDAPVISFNKLKISFVFIKLILMKKDYDIVHIHGNSPFFSDVSLLFFKLFRKKIIYTYHCDASLVATMKTATNTTRLIERVYNYIMKLLTKYADIVTFTTESYSYSRCDKAKQYAIIPSGVDQKFFTSLNIRDFEETPRKILFVGQLQPYKGVDLLIEAGKGLNLAIYIAGKGDLFDFYKKKTRGIKNITMLGFVPDDVLLEWYAKAHFVVLPSISAAEAFGLVTLEGMAGGCVPITCDLPGVKDLSKTTGLVFACGDVSDLARKLSQAGDISIAELQKRSEASIAFARGYLWDRCVDLYAELYERVKHRNKA